MLRLFDLQLIGSKEELKNIPEGKVLINTINAHSYNVAQRDPLFAEALRTVNVNVNEEAVIGYRLSVIEHQSSAVSVERLAVSETQPSALSLQPSENSQLSTFNFQLSTGDKAPAACGPETLKYLIPDGNSIVKACRWLKAKSQPKERIAGWDLFCFEMGRVEDSGAVRNGAELLRNADATKRFRYENIDGNGNVNGNGNQDSEAVRNADATIRCRYENVDGNGNSKLYETEQGSYETLRYENEKEKSNDNVNVNGNQNENQDLELGTGDVQSPMEPAVRPVEPGTWNRPLAAMEPETAAIRHKKVMFMGSSERVLEKIKKRAEVDYPNLEIVTYSPPYKPEFSEEDNQAIINAINDANPDLLWIGMTAPKQEKWVWQHWQELNINCHVGTIGAVFDFYAGTARRAPRWWQEHGLEWLYRLIKEPRRMWRRYVIGNPLFIWNVMKERSCKGY